MTATSPTFAAAWRALPESSPVARHSLIAHLREAGVDEDQLADIALRGLSPSLNDPTTAENAIDMLADLLLRWATGAEHLPPLDETWTDRLRQERLTATA